MWQGMNGFIKTYRSLLEWEWYREPATARLWEHLRLTVNYYPKEWRGMVIERGQRVATRAALTEETGLTDKQVRTALERLQACGELRCEASKKFTLITVINYDLYSGELDDEKSRGQQTANKGPTEISGLQWNNEPFFEGSGPTKGQQTANLLIKQRSKEVREEIKNPLLSAREGGAAKSASSTAAGQDVHGRGAEKEAAEQAERERREGIADCVFYWCKVSRDLATSPTVQQRIAELYDTFGEERLRAAISLSVAERRTSLASLIWLLERSWPKLAALRGRK